MDYTALKAELAVGHPGTGDYDADDAIAAGQLNAVNRTRDKTSLTGSEVLNAIDKTEYLALTDPMKQLVWNVLHIGEINPFGVEAALFVEAFGQTSATIAALQTKRVEAVSRAEELGLGFVFPGDVENARY